MFRAAAVCLIQILLLTVVCVAHFQDNSQSKQPGRPYGVPDASLPCSPEEQSWWAELKQVAEDVKYRGRSEEKQKQKFLDVLHKGIEKGYRPPVPDTRPIILFKTEPMYTNEARARGVHGTIKLEVELLPDGSVGKIQIIQGLSGGLNEATEATARKMIFLPAIKNQQFVTQSLRVEMTFQLY